MAGVDATLASRMLGGAAEGNLRAKTGTLSGASALSRIVHTEEDRALAFSIVVNHFVGSGAPWRDAQDRAGEILAGLGDTD